MSEGIPTNIDNILKSLAKSDKELKIATLRREWAEARQGLIATQFVGDVDAIACNVVMNKHRKFKPIVRRKSSKTKPIVNMIGFKIGDTGMVDDAQRIREWAKFVVDRDGKDAAAEQGLIIEMEDHIAFVDTRQKIFGRPNPNFGSPLDAKLKLRRRNLIFLAKQADGKKLEYTRLQTNDNKLAVIWDQLPDHVPVTWPARLQTHDSAGYMLSSSMAQATQTVFTAVKTDWDVYNLFTTTLKDAITPIQDFYKYHLATEKAWDRWCLLKGMVASIAFENPTYRGIACTLMDSEQGFDSDYQVRFYIPEHLKVTFGQYSEIYLLGRSRAIKDADPAGGKKKITVDAVLDAWGFYGVPGRVTNPKESLLEEDDDDIDISGFIPLG